MNMNDAVRYQVMPPLSAEEYQELHDSIKTQGVLEPIHVDEDGVVIDGHHRSKIATELGIPCPVITHDDLDEAGKRSLAFTLNLKRRHLNREQRRALIAESLKADPQLSNREHARRTGADHKTVRSVRDEGVQRGEIPHVEETTDSMGRKQPATRPALQPRPEPAPAPGFNPGDLEELNTPRPTAQPTMEPPKPRRTPLPDIAMSAVVELQKAIKRLENIVTDDRFENNKTQIRDSYLSDLGRAQETLADIIHNIK